MPAGNHFNLLYLVSLTFQVSVIILKKAKMRRVSPSIKLKDIIVNNYLNIFSLFAIIFIMALLTLTIWIHFYTIEVNSAATTAPTYWKNILFISAIETLFQSIAFVNSPALR